jgi:hypothetical protein
VTFVAIIVRPRHPKSVQTVQPLRCDVTFKTANYASSARVEFPDLVTLTVPHNRVGDNDNNMQDHIGKFGGALAAALIINGRIVTRTTKA